jgi:tetratricopeptide (TPR) repeat protein
MKRVIITLIVLLLAGCATFQPQSSRVVIEKSKESYHNGNYKKSQRYLTELLRREPQNLEAHYERGKSNYQLYDYTNAIRDFEYCLDNNYNKGDSAFYLSEIYEDYDNYEKALKYINIYLKFTKEDIDTEAYWNKCMALLNLKRNKEALSAVKGAVRKNKDNAEMYNLQGIVYTHMKQYRNSVKSFDKGISLDGDNKYLENNLGRCYLAQKKYDMADEHFNLATDIDTQYLPPYFYKVRAFISLKEYDKAEKVLKTAALKKAVKNRYGNTQIIDYWYGEIYFSKEYYKKAFDYYWKANDNSAFMALTIVERTIIAGEYDQAGSMLNSLSDWKLNDKAKLWYTGLQLTHAVVTESDDVTTFNRRFLNQYNNKVADVEFWDCAFLRNWANKTLTGRKQAKVLQMVQKIEKNQIVVYK